jgi:hypothetical protein
MCGRIFFTVLVAIGAFVGVTVAAFVHLQWWQAILASVALLAVLFLGGKFLLRTAIKAWGEQLTKLTAGQAVVLRNATIQVHKVQRADPPRELTDEDEFDDEDPESRAERNEEVLGKTWYKIEMTVFPNPDIEESVNPWSPESLVFVPFDREPPSNMLADAMDDDILHPDRMKRIADAAEDAELTGPQRTLFLLGVPNEVRDLAVRYFTEQFGRIRLPGPFDESPRIRES